ncbi:response regulator transcription factor [Streptomyces sp. NPDC054940]
MADNPAFPWARTYDADQLSAFVDDLWGAASGDNDLATLDAIEEVIAEHRPDIAVPRCPLTERELQILTQLANGETYESAAGNLTISANSVRARCPQIYARLGAKNAVQAAAIAARHGWLADMQVPAPVEDVPRILHGPHAWNRRYHQRAAEMRDKPGLPLDIGPYGSRSGARGAARCIRRGLYDAFQPAGSFDARTVRSEHGTWLVSARYVGTTHNTAPGSAT